MQDLFLEQMVKLEEKHGKSVPTKEAYLTSTEQGFTTEEIKAVIDRLKRKGDLYVPRSGYLQRV